MKRFFLGILAGFVMCSSGAMAQNTAVPELPEPLQNLVGEGAQVRYLGNEHGLDGWFTIKNGVQQYFYVLPDKSAFLMGLLYDKDGKVVTLRQVQNLQASGDTLLESLAEVPTKEPSEDQFELKTPSEQLFADIQGSNWVPLGKAGAPVVYAFIDPQCPHCHAFVNSHKILQVPTYCITLCL